MPPAGRARPTLARYAAPAAFLLAVTIAVLLIRAGLGGGSGSETTTTLGPARQTTAERTTTRAETSAARRFYTVQTGDTFGSIAGKTGTSVAELEQLNPGVSSNSLRVGQKLRVK